MALNPSSVTFNSAYPLTGGKWRVDFTSPMINGFPFQYIQDFSVKWANFTAADTGLESVTVGGVTKLVGDSSTWAINSATVTGYATFATSAAAIANSNIVFQHTEYGEEDLGGGGPGGGGGGPSPVTTTDFVNLSVTIEAAADGFSPNPYLLTIAAGAGNQFPTASTLTVGYSISDLTVTYPANFWADMGISDASFGNNWETTHSNGSESSATGNLNASTAQVNLTVFEAGPPGTVSKTITVHATNSVTASVTDYDLTFTITRPGAAVDNVTVTDLGLESVVSAAANVGSFDVNPLAVSPGSTVSGANWLSQTSTFSHEIKSFTLAYNTSILTDLGLDYIQIYDESINSTSPTFNQANWQNIGSDFPYIRFGAVIAGPIGVVSQDVTFSIEFFSGTIEEHVVTLSVERTATDDVTVTDLALVAVVFEAVNVADLALAAVVSDAPEAVTVADLALQTSVFEPVTVADLGLNANVFEPVTVADIALESHVVEGVTVAELNLSSTVYETVAAPVLALNTLVLDVVQPSINLVLRVTEPLPEAVNVANLRLISVIETPEPVTVQNLKLTAIVADGTFAFNPNTSFCGELS